MKLNALARTVLVSLLLIAAFAAGQHSPSTVAAQSHPKWEYQIVVKGLHSPDNLTDRINKLSDDGWEPVAMNDQSVLLRRSK